MRKKVLSVISVIALGVFASLNIYFNQQDNVQFSDLAMDNVEALARGEGIGSYYIVYGWNGDYGNTYLNKKCTSGGYSIC